MKFKFLSFCKRCLHVSHESYRRIFTLFHFHSFFRFLIYSEKRFVPSILFYLISFLLLLLKYEMEAESGFDGTVPSLSSLAAASTLKSLQQYGMKHFLGQKTLERHLPVCGPPTRARVEWRRVPFHTSASSRASRRSSLCLNYIVPPTTHSE